MAQQVTDTLYSMTCDFYREGCTIRFNEVPIKNETAKSYMGTNEQRYPKEEEGKVIIDHYNGHFWNARLFLYEATLEEAKTFGIQQLKHEVQEWLEKRASYYTTKLASLEVAEIK